MSPFAALFLVVPLVWPARFVGADDSCFRSADPPIAPVAPVAPAVDTEVAEAPAPVAPAPPAPVDAIVGSPVAVAAWGEIGLAIVRAPVEDAG